MKRQILIAEDEVMLREVAAEMLENEGIGVSVVDMPSYDGDLLRAIAASGSILLFVEQNNGALYDQFCRDCVRLRFNFSIEKIYSLNVRDNGGNLRFIQSGTYDELVTALGLTANDIAMLINDALSESN